MSFKDILKEKVPEYLQQTPEFPIFLKIIERENINSGDDLKHFLSAEIERKEKKIEELDKQGSTSNRDRVELAKETDFLKLIQEKILPYVQE